MNGDILKQLRLEKGLTQQELGDKINVSGSTIRMIEIKKRNGSIDVCSKLADFFGVSMDYLEGRTTYKNDVEVAIALIDKLKNSNVINTVDDIDENMITSINNFIKNKNKH